MKLKKIVEIEEDEKNFEQVIESYETDELVEVEEIVEIEEIVEVEEVIELYKIVNPVPFSIIEEAPIFKGCDKYNSKTERKKCSAESIQKFVNTNFNTKIIEGLNLSRVQKIYTVFHIDKNGLVRKIRSRGAHPKLEQEANRVVKSMPKFTRSGQQKGKPVDTSYTLPITFETTD